MVHAGGNKKLLNEHPLVENGQKLIPDITRVFRKNQKLYVYFEVYDPGTVASPSVSAELTMFRGKSKAFESAPVRVTKPKSGRPNTLAFEFEMPLANIPPGRYTCQVSVIDEQARKFGYRPRAAGCLAVIAQIVNSVGYFKLYLNANCSLICCPLNSLGSGGNGTDALIAGHRRSIQSFRSRGRRDHQLRDLPIAIDDELQLHHPAIAHPRALRNHGEPILSNQRENLHQIGPEIHAHRVAHQLQAAAGTGRVRAADECSRVDPAADPGRPPTTLPCPPPPRAISWIASWTLAFGGVSLAWPLFSLGPFCPGVSNASLGCSTG